MRPHPKIRKTVKWGGAIASVLLAVVWVGSGWWWVWVDGPVGTAALVGSGTLGIACGRWSPDLPSHTKLVPASGPVDFRGKFQFERDGTLRGVMFPIWLPFAALTLIAAVAWWLDRRTRQWGMLGACTKCGYNRAGLAAGAVCPECGAGAGAAAGSQK